MNSLPYREVWLADFEFRQPEGERVTQVHCLVAHEFWSGRTIRLWRDEMHSLPPFNIGRNSLFVAYMAAAEASCFLELGWSMPANILDLYVEFRNATNGLPRPFGLSLAGALSAHGLESVDVEEKEAMRALAIRGAPFTAQERRNLLEYCESDVHALKRLLPAMLPRILRRRDRPDRVNLSHALLRGRYMGDVARMERAGVPVDAPTLSRLNTLWPAIKRELVTAVDSGIGVYEGTTFKVARFNSLVERLNIPWPRLASGAPALDDQTFRQMAKSHRIIASLHELRATMGQLRLAAIKVGADGRNRTSLRPFGSVTGRNQPSNSRFVFGPATWIRSLIMPPPGHVIAYLDWSAQEIGIAAALSGDEAMMADYGRDPYLAFARRARRVPPEATKQTHRAVREAVKSICLGAQYGRGAKSIAEQIGGEIGAAEAILRDHQRIYRRFWTWSDGVVDHSMLAGHVETVFGWNLAGGGFDFNPRTARNFPMQANGAEMMRLAVHYLHAAGIEVVAPVHDALLVAVPEGDAEELIPHAAGLMERASRDVLGGFTIHVGDGADSAAWVRPGCRYVDDRGTDMWAKVSSILASYNPPPLADGGLRQ